MPNLRFYFVCVCLCLAGWGMLCGAMPERRERAQRFDQPPRARLLINAALTSTTPRARDFAAQQLAREIDASLRDPGVYYQ